MTWGQLHELLNEVSCDMDADPRLKHLAAVVDSMIVLVNGFADIPEEQCPPEVTASIHGWYRQFRAIKYP